MPRCGECRHLVDGDCCEIDDSVFYDPDQLDDPKAFIEAPCPYYVPEGETLKADKKVMTAEEFLAKVEAAAKKEGNKKVLRNVKLMQKMLKSRITGVLVRGMIEKELAKEETQKKLQEE